MFSLDVQINCLLPNARTCSRIIASVYTRAMTMTTNSSSSSSIGNSAHRVKPSSQYDAGAVSITSIVSILGKVFFLLIHVFLMYNFDNLKGWMQANADNTTLEQKLQCHHNAHDATLAPAR